ncbi:MAG: FAD-dependent oxidoreductase [Clostridiales Family XIII bacterium]|jgi:NADPH-dependent 2,4-dienoyl-CoA reductase/sulfur reductase-like enzyme/rhodanese-related sulfurtransferase|nr:FAD-dependent oxidoreductase [Clostridiales Family XIII bacterium]
MKKILIIGGVAGGATAAARLRRLDENAEIVVLEKGGHVSFANCGLPYYIGGVIKDRSSLLLQTPQGFLKRYRIDARVNNEALSIDRASKTVLVREIYSGREYSERYDHLILSPGASPIVPDITGVNSDRVFMIRNMADTDALKSFINDNKPRSAAIAGGGYIGLEMAENLKGLGLSVTILQRPDQVIAPLDYDMACDVRRHLVKNGVKVILKSGVEAINETPDGLLIRAGGLELAADMLILAVGVKPDIRLAAEAGLDIGPNGGILVDAHMRTSDPDVYAVGDATAIPEYVSGQDRLIPLAGPANKQGRVAADNICGIATTYKGTQGSVIIKVFDMTVAATGLNEKNARNLGLNYDKVFTYTASHAGYYPGGRFMSVKTIFEKGSGRLLGAQAVGFEGTDKRCDVLASAIRAGMTAYDLTELELCYAPPYSSAKDPVNVTGYVIENLLEGRVKNFHWHDVDALPPDGSANLVDVRTPDEYAKGHVNGFVNIPLDSLRERMNELHKAKPVYIICQIGLRGYIAARILSQKGFDAYNLSGGYRLYASVMNSD